MRFSVTLTVCGPLFRQNALTLLIIQWAFIELARHLKIQETLRAELHKYLSRDQTPTYDHLMNNLPYLDAFTCELLRFRPVTLEVSRVVMLCSNFQSSVTDTDHSQANEDDTIPLSQSITISDGVVTDAICVSKGTYIRIPIVGVNRSEALWGADASTFDPTRWLEPDSTDLNRTSARKEEIRGYRHLLTFVDGPRMCPGRHFAVTQLKVRFIRVFDWSLMSLFRLFCRFC